MESNKMKNDVKKKGLAVLGAGVLYLIWIKATGWMIPCIFRRVTGLKCPGCGVTHMLLGLLRLDFTGARTQNAFLFYTLPLLAAEIIYARVMASKRKQLPRWNEVLLLIYCAALIVFGILRNIL